MLGFSAITHLLKALNDISARWGQNSITPKL